MSTLAVTDTVRDLIQRDGFAGPFKAGLPCKALARAAAYVDAVLSGRRPNPLYGRISVRDYHLVERRIRFIFPDDSEGLAPTVVAHERHLLSKGDCVGPRRWRNDLSGSKTIGEISHFARGDRDSATTFVDVLDLLRSAVSGAPFRHRVGQRLQT